MANPVYSYKDYAWWVAQQVWGPALSRSPGDCMRQHRDGWADQFAKFVQPSTVLETPALVIARWEFLGGLYRGNAGRTGMWDAVSFARRFLNRVNPRYDDVHNLAGRQAPERLHSDLYMMLRNKPLHGFTPAAIDSEDQSGVVAWWVAPAETGGDHLVVDSAGKIHVNGTKLYTELLGAMVLFASYLDANVATIEDEDVVSQHLPQARWLGAFWARYCPHGMNVAKWLSYGEPYRIPRIDEVPETQ